MTAINWAKIDVASAAHHARGPSRDCITPGCAGQLHDRAYRAGVPGSGVECQACLERRHGAPLDEIIARTGITPKYPTTGTIDADAPSVWGSALLGWEGRQWAEFASRHSSEIDTAEPAPYARGVGAGFGQTADGQEG